MKRITCVYTGMGGLVEQVEKIFRNAVGEAQFHHILDSGLIKDIVEQGGVTGQLEKRIFALYDAAAQTDADVIVSTCSSIGNVTEEYAAAHPEVPIMRIDYPMAKDAAEHRDGVVVLATLSTTVEPSAGLVRRLAKEAGRSIEVREVTIPGAFAAMMAGDMEKARERVRDCVRRECAGADTVLLAQASMSFFHDILDEELAEGVRVLESPGTCAEYLAG